MGRPRARYSNFGFELLGHAIAATAGLPCADPVHQRIADPLGLDRFTVPRRPTGSAPIAPFGGGAHIGASWITLTAKERRITWHNGGT